MSPAHQAQLASLDRERHDTRVQPASKKRKIDDSQSSAQYPDSKKRSLSSTSYVRNEETEHLLFSAEASFAVPVRKKLNVSFFQNGQEGPGHGGLEIAAGDVRFGFRWGEIGT